MSKFVPYLSEDQIERDAYALLAEYAQKRALVIEPPIPIDDIVEKHLKLGIEFDDTHRLFGVPRDPDRDADILGAMFFDDGRIVIDESLDPEENPVKEGRYRFTLAHEVGHWRLHRHRFAKNREQAVLFGGPAEASIICRSSQAKERIEWQADFYASCLVLPKELLISAWRERFGNTKPRILKRKNPLILPGATDEITTALRSFDQQLYDDGMNSFAFPFARKFQVSMVSMRIRLEWLGLLHRDVPRQRSSMSVS